MSRNNKLLHWRISFIKLTTSLIRSLLLLLTLAPTLVLAQSLTILPTQKSQAPYITHSTFIRELKPTLEKPIQFIPLGTNADIPPGSHLRILYTSHNPLPLEIGFKPQPETDFVTAILPPAEKGDVLLPLTVSPSWKWNINQLIVNAYILAEEFPEELGVQTVSLLSPWERFLVYMVQPWTSEVFGSSSINFLYGYRSAGIPLTPILAIITIVISLIVFVIRRKSLLPAIAGTCLMMILLYQARFMIDLVPETFARAREWLTDRTYGEMTYTYQIAELLPDVTKSSLPLGGRVRERGSKKSSFSVATCKDSATALGYLLHPIPVRVEEEAWKESTHAVVTLYPWEEVPETFACHDIARSASIVKQFPTGDTIIRFTDI